MTIQQALKRDEFLSGISKNFEAAKGQKFRGSIWEQSKDSNSVTIRGFERRMLFQKRPTGVVIASVLTKTHAIDRYDLSRHISRMVEYEVCVQYIIGVYSPTGFDDIHNAHIPNNATVILIEHSEKDGWRVTAKEDVEDWLWQLFDPEGAKGKIERVERVERVERLDQRLGRLERLIEEHSTDLLTGSIPASVLAAETGLPEHLVRQDFERITATNPELRLTNEAGELLLFRGAMQCQEKPRNVLKLLFSKKSGSAEKINMLAERRAVGTHQRDTIYKNIGELERIEADLLTQGKAAKSSVPRRRQLAAQLAQTRKDIARQNTTAAMINKQIDIISTDIHNLTLIRQGEAAKLPDTVELTEHAVQAEEINETLRSNADLASELDTNIGEVASEEELEILKEFEESETDSQEEPEKKDDDALGDSVVEACKREVEACKRDDRRTTRTLSSGINDDADLPCSKALADGEDEMARIRQEE